MIYDNEKKITEERLHYLHVTHFGVDFLPDSEEFLDINAALRELTALRRQLREAHLALVAGARLCDAIPGMDKTGNRYTDFAEQLLALASKGKGV